jgi:ABC-2 type transport system permease protein
MEEVLMAAASSRGEIERLEFGLQTKQNPYIYNGAKARQMSAIFEVRVREITGDYEAQRISESLSQAKALLESGEYAQQAEFEGYTPEQMAAEVAELETQLKKQQTENEKFAKTVSEMKEAFLADDYAEFIKIKNEFIKWDPLHDPEIRDILISENELYLKADPKGEDEGMALTNALSIVSAIQSSLRDNINYYNPDKMNTVLSLKDREELEDKLAVSLYQIENGYIDLTNNDLFGFVSPSVSAIDFSISAGISMLLILLCILTGMTAAQEISNGSIKSQIVAPVKRSKIFFGKFCSLLIVFTVFLALIYVISLLSGLAFGGKSETLPYVYARAGVAHQLNFYAYRFFMLLFEGLDVLVFLVLAFMLSFVARSIAVSVAVPLALYFVGSSGMAIASQFLRGEWLKFIPFSNIGLGTRVFPGSGAAEAASSILGEATVPSVTFSLVYLAVAVFCMMYTGYDSFTRRDLK